MGKKNVRKDDEYQIVLRSAEKPLNQEFTAKALARLLTGGDYDAYVSDCLMDDRTPSDNKKCPGGAVTPTKGET